MFTNIRYILITATRDRLFLGLLLGIAFACYVSHAMGGTALLEPEQMIMSFSAASSRVIVMIGLIVFVCFHVRNAFDSREIDVLLSRPITRVNLVISYWLGFAVAATILVLAIVAILAFIGILNHNGYYAWGVSLLLESWLVIAIALFASFTLRSGVSAVLASLGFYALARMMGYFLATKKSGVIFDNATVSETFRWVIDGVSLVIPRLDFFAKSQWLVYGLKGYQELYLFLAQAAIFIPLLLAATVIDFRRKQF